MGVVEPLDHQRSQRHRPRPTSLAQPPTHSLRPLLVRGITDSVAKAVPHLGATQNQDGGWGQRPGEPSDILATAHAIPAIARSTTAHPLQLAVDYLMADPKPNGGFSALPDQVGPRPFPYNYPSLTDIHVLTALNHALDTNSL